MNEVDALVEEVLKEFLLDVALIGKYSVSAVKMDACLTLCPVARLQLRQFFLQTVGCVNAVFGLGGPIYLAMVLWLFLMAYAIFLQL